MSQPAFSFGVEALRPIAFMMLLASVGFVRASDEPARGGTDSEAHAAASVQRIELNDETAAALKRHVEPTDAESAWLRIPWLPTFGEGVIRADAEAKPLLLWVMNGHPLGCT